MKLRVAEVALDARSGGSDAVYTYLAGPGLAAGDACFVPLGNREALGFVVGVDEVESITLSIDVAALRPSGDVVENLSLPLALLSLARFVSEEYLCPLPVALSAATPPAIRDRIVSSWSLIGESDVTPLQASLLSAPGEKPGEGAAWKNLSTAQAETIRVLRESGGVYAETPTRKTPPSMLKALRMLQAKGIVKPSLRIAPFRERRRGQGLLRLSADTAAVEGFLAKEGRRKPAQALTLMRLQQADAGAALAPAEIKVLAGVTDTTIKALADSGLLVEAETSAGGMAKPPRPNRFQQLAIDAVVDAVESCEYRPFLLFGVTGSGKTEVYLRAAAEAIRRGRQVLYLVPEIALAAQAIGQLRERFGQSVAILHSDLSPGERLANWTAIRSGEASVVLGARSALFAPLDRIGLIVVDEEHEASYKQESAPRYHAKQLALFLGRTHACPVVLGSATPSVESFFEAEQDRLTLLSLPERAASAKLPTVKVDDLAAGFRTGRPDILSVDLQERLAATLDKGHQAILFLNRRAYAPFIICRDCGHQMTCPHCAVSLSFHRRDGRLRCHHCGYQMRPPDICPQCRGTRLNPFGVGTEKVEETVAARFPDARVARLDRDVARKAGALEEVLASFRSGDIQVLVGTQMVAKGLDFPNVTLVGVIAADISLNLPDFRASERTFQLLSQVAGRAGRGREPGEVVIQTFNPDHVAVQTARDHDYTRFFEAMREERQAASYPPFRRLVNVVASGEDRGSVIAAADQIAASLKPILTEGSELLGPVDCAMERLQNRWRRHLLLKLLPPGRLDPYAEALSNLHFKGTQVMVDVDPYSLM